MVEVVCAVIKNDENQVLLVQRSHAMPHPGQWEFPGGKVEKGEKHTAALKREIREELGLEVETLQALKPEEHTYPTKKIVLIPVICEIRSGNLLLNEHCGHRWLKIDETAGFDLLEADRGIVRQLKELL